MPSGRILPYILTVSSSCSINSFAIIAVLPKLWRHVATFYPKESETHTVFVQTKSVNFTKRKSAVSKTEDWRERQRENRFKERSLSNPNNPAATGLTEAVVCVFRVFNPQPLFGRLRLPIVSASSLARSRAPARFFVKNRKIFPFFLK